LPVAVIQFFNQPVVIAFILLYMKRSSQETSLVAERSEPEETSRASLDRFFAHSILDLLDSAEHPNPSHP
jgi:hypothetical protein